MENASLKRLLSSGLLLSPAAVGELQTLHKRLGQLLAGASSPATAPKLKRPRKPITDPEALERRRLGLARAREARAQKLAAERAAATSAYATAMTSG